MSDRAARCSREGSSPGGMEMTYKTGPHATDNLLHFYRWRRRDDDSWVMNGIGWYGVASPWKPNPNEPKLQVREVTVQIKGMLPGTVVWEETYMWHSSLYPFVQMEFIQSKLNDPKVFKRIFGEFQAQHGHPDVGVDTFINTHRYGDWTRSGRSRSNPRGAVLTLHDVHKEYEIELLVGPENPDTLEKVFVRLVWRDVTPGVAMPGTGTWTITNPGFDVFMFAAQQAFEGKTRRGFKYIEKFRQEYTVDVTKRQEQIC